MDDLRRNRPARSRREQALRAEARTVSRFLRGMAQLQTHRGSQPSRIGAAIAAALQEASKRMMSRRVLQLLRQNLRLLQIQRRDLRLRSLVPSLPLRTFSHPRAQLHSTQLPPMAPPLCKRGRVDGQAADLLAASTTGPTAITRGPAAVDDSYMEVADAAPWLRRSSRARAAGLQLL